MHPEIYCTSYCNRGHRLSDGKPVQHECRIIPPAALEAERNDDFSLAQKILAETPAQYMRRGVKG